MAIDFSDLGGQPVQQGSIDFSDLGGQSIKGNLIDKLGPIGTYSALLDALPDSPATRIQKGLKTLGGNIAEEGGKVGYPKTGIALGGAVALAPDILATTTGLEGLYKSQNPIVKGLLNSPSELGADFAAQNDAIGVTRRVPVEGGMKPSFPVHGNVPPEVLGTVVPSKYPANTGAFLAYANNKLANLGDAINPQELMDWQVKLQTDLNSGRIPQFDKTTGRITTAFQQASDLLSRTKQAFNRVASNALTPEVQAQLPEGAIKNRPDLNRAFRVSTTAQNPIRAAIPPQAAAILKKYAPAVLEGLGFGAATRFLKNEMK